MVALLILGGLLLIITGLVWLVMLAFGTSLLWGIGSLIPPINLAYALRHWRIARKAVVLGSMGAIPLVVGVTMLAAQDPGRLQAILSLRWMGGDEPQLAELDIRLRGELNGQRFLPQHAELIDGVLTLREGHDFYARRELVIRLGEQPQGALRLDVLPQDAGKQPEVEISWVLPDQDLPEARRIPRGYTLHLDLQPVAPNKLAGEFHLVLPPRFATTLSGRLELFMDQLRYRDGRVDATYDSRDTLAHVIHDYLQRRFSTREVDLRPLPPLSLPARELEVQVGARIAGQPQDLLLQLFKSDASGWRVRNDRYPPLAPVVPQPATATLVVARDAVGSISTSLPVDRREHFSLQQLLTNPRDYQNLELRVATLRGSMAQGRFAGLDRDGRLVIRRSLGGSGEASFSVGAEEIERIELLEP